MLIETEELKPKVRSALRQVVELFDRWTAALDTKPHTELAEQILEESGYTDMWKADRSAEAPGRLENLKELIRSMEDYESLRAFLEHVALVMDAEQNEELDAVNIMTLHAAKGLEFNTVFLPGWEEGLFPHQRALDEGGRSGLEEERRLAYVGLTRAKHRAHLWFVSNRRIHGLWQSTIPSRFLDELPAAHVEVMEAGNGYGGYGQSGGFARQNPYGASRFDDRQAFTASYSTPGWQRAQQNRTEATAKNWGNRSGPTVERIAYGETDSDLGAGRGSVKPRTIDGELVAKSVSTEPSRFVTGDRVFHIKFGNGNITAIEGNKLTILFDRAGEKRVLDGFVERV
jgi:DNA helicase-2/ATP-dependent DNA helicase PcrA